MNAIEKMRKGKTPKYIKGSDFALYVRITLRHVDTIDLAALYVESFINGFRDDYSSIIADELLARPDGFDTLIQLCAVLYQQGALDAIIPVELRVMQNLMERGNAFDALHSLIENNNLKNAVRIIVAGCEWLPADKIDDALLDEVVNHLSSLAH